VRALLEGEAAALCAKRARPEQIEGMRQALADFERAVRNEDSARRLSATADFYRIMQEAAGNTLIEELLRRLLARINMLRAQSMSRAGRARFSFTEMRAMFQAISKGDSRAARKAAETHVKNASHAARAMVESVEAERKSSPPKREKEKEK